LVYKTPKDVQERKDAKKKLILDTALKVFTSRGYHGTSVKDIVDEAGISVGSFYFYFKSKEDLFEILYDEVAQLLFSALDCAIDSEEKDKVRNFTSGITNFLSAVQENWELTKILMIEAVGLNPRFERKRAQAAKMFADNAAESFEKWNREGSVIFRNARITAVAFIGSIDYAIENWLQGNLPYDLRELAFNLSIHTLQAFKLDFDDTEIKKYIDEILEAKVGKGGII